MSASLTLRNVEVAGVAGLDVRLEHGCIADIGRRLRRSGDDLDGAGGALIPGLVDHHIHLLALAARRSSVDLADAEDPLETATRLRDAVSARLPGEWVRAVGYHEGTADLLDAAALDAVAPHHPLRVQHRTGALWVLNSAALSRALGADPPPPCVDLDAAGRPTGRIWRGDAWLADRLGRAPPPLAPVGRALAACGITAATDASATTDAEAAAVLTRAHAAGELPQKLMVMSAGELSPPPGVALGPVKILLDDDALPDLDAMIAHIGRARTWRRAVAVHCVTAAELALALAAFETAGSAPGDRIEHGSIIPAQAVAAIRSLGLTVVTQPGLVSTRGDRYLAEVPPGELADLYRLRSLVEAGVPLAASSDAPYGEPDPWDAVAASVARRTRTGRTLGPAEALPARRSLELWLGDPADPGGAARRVRVGAPADLCLLDRPLDQALAAPRARHVAATFIAGAMVFEAKGRTVAA